MNTGTGFVTTDINERFLALSEEMAGAVQSMQSAGAEEAQEASAEEGRGALRWLKNLQSLDLPMEEWMALGTSSERLAKADNLRQLVKLYLKRLRSKRKKKPDIEKTDIAVEDAIHAAAAMAQAVAEQAMVLLPERHPHRAKLEALIATLPEQAEMRQTQSGKRLIDTLSLGLDRVSEKQVTEQHPAQRLADIGKHLEESVRQLRSVDDMPPPSREESIELAREILRKLRRLAGEDKPLKEMIDAGQIGDKLALAQKVEEMADTIKNLVLEAAQGDKSIMQDLRIKEATEAVNSFSHAIKLMAAKEMPGSVAAAQQISAEAAQTPEEWSKLNDRTVGRLVKSMEGGLEKAAATIESQEQQQQDAERQQEAAAEAATQEQGKRKKRRRRSSASVVTKGAKAAIKRRNAGDLNGDGVMDKFQGINQQNSIRLNDRDLELIRQLGGTLRGIGNEAQELAAAAAPPPAVSAPANNMSTDRIIPGDDRSFTQRTTEERQQNNPRNNGNNRRPRV